MKRKTVLFLDNTHPKAYDSQTLQLQAIGGTEASVVKTAQILSSHFNVVVAQKYRIEEQRESEFLAFIPKFAIQSVAADYVIVLRKYPELKPMRRYFPKAKLFLWLHTYKNTEYAFKKKGLAKLDCTIICNSKTHQQHTDYLLNHSKLAKTIGIFTKPTKVSFCYNPVQQPQQQNSKRDTNKLLYFSSPNKGLKQVLHCFAKISQNINTLHLYIANPGYKQENNLHNAKNISILGSLPHAKMMQHVANSLCVFYPQDTFAETFGLIYAEANAYGTPVLAHDIGAAKEILHPNNPLIDAHNQHLIEKVITSWQKQAPAISYNPQFSAPAITKQWCSLFG